VVVVATETIDRFSQPRVDKFAQRRAQLAEAALQTLSELGYARTSMRDIAQNSAFSHGVLHYYFRDKVDLIAESVRQYKEQCVTRYDEIVATAGTSDELATGIGAAMVDTLQNEAPFHRLWYDLRSQSLFDDAYRTDVLEIDAGLESMIWRIVTRYAELVDRPPAVSSAQAYALFDGLFQQALLKHLCGEPEAAPALAASVEHVMPLLLRPNVGSLWSL
jgi:AcrR family transcriptional regulator